MSAAHSDGSVAQRIVSLGKFLVNNLLHIKLSLLMMFHENRRESPFQSAKYVV